MVKRNEERTISLSPMLRTLVVNKFSNTKYTKEHKGHEERKFTLCSLCFFVSESSDLCVTKYSFDAAVGFEPT